MTAATLILQTVFSLLVVAALAYGMRLNRRLVELRESQAGFAAAVGELDRAAARAEAGLQALRRSTDTAEQELAHRIDAARGLAAKLATLNSDAALAVKRMEGGRRDAGGSSDFISFPLRGEAARSAGGAARGARSEAAEDDFAENASAPPAHRATGGRPFASATDPHLRRSSGPPLRAEHREETLAGSGRPDAPPAPDAAELLRRVAELLRAPDELRARTVAGARR